VTDIKKQLQFWKDRGRLDKGVVADDLLDLSFIGEDPPEAKRIAGLRYILHRQPQE
jgi:hypothetical protein